MTCGDPADPTIFHRSQLRGDALTSSFAEEATAMQLALEWATRQPPRAVTLQRRSIDTQGNRTSVSIDPSPKITPQRTTGPDNPPVDTRAQRNLWQRNRRHRSQNSRYNRHQRSEAHFLCTRGIPHPLDAYKSTTGKFVDSGVVWQVLLVQGLHGH